MSVMMGYNGAGGGGGSGAPTADILYPESDFSAEAPHNPPDPLQPHPQPCPRPPYPFPSPSPATTTLEVQVRGQGGDQGGDDARQPKAKFDVNDNSLYSVYCFFKYAPQVGPLCQSGSLCVKQGG
ncbi:hypothetical protein Pcinc_032012 [Petrolisthes cinctipes]|uniref:Uncharacterized protein n=1 Tax=Petrolisthes cinctipes TaxID=88211 RepID=A0AAE1K406_PETCI|nr:hypothetical protein Pcinc_032012 [Petrolisthes cinctipes]